MTGARSGNSTTRTSVSRKGNRHVFVTTRWSLVLAAGRGHSPDADNALGDLCQTYWYPLYGYVRRRGYSAEDAQDLTQEFFSRLLAQNWVEQADRERGRFRTFLLSAMSHFLANEWDRARAKKRGGSAQIIPLQLDAAETRYGMEPTDPFTPEEAYERRWALTLLDTVLQQLQKEYSGTGKQPLFKTLKGCLVGETENQPYAALAMKLGITEGNVKVAVHRLRQRYRHLLRREIANTVANPAEVDEEMRHLFAVLAK